MPRRRDGHSRPTRGRSASTRHTLQSQTVPDARGEGPHSGGGGETGDETALRTRGSRHGRPRQPVDLGAISWGEVVRTVAREMMPHYRRRPSALVRTERAAARFFPVFVNSGRNRTVRCAYGAPQELHLSRRSGNPVDRPELTVRRLCSRRSCRWLRSTSVNPVKHDWKTATLTPARRVPCRTRRHSQRV